MDELLNLSDSELNARAAKALGWVEEKTHNGDMLWAKGSKVMAKGAWHPASSLEQAFLLQEEVARRRLQRSYGYILENLLLSKTTFWTSWFGMSWEVAASTARPRTIAAVYVLEGGK